MLERLWKTLGEAFSRRDTPPRIDFARPANWSMEKVQGGTLLRAPVEEMGWQANIFVETRVNDDWQLIDAGLKKTSAELAKRHQNYREISRDSGLLPSGLRHHRLTYTSTNEGTPLTQWEVLIELEGDPEYHFVLFILASAATAVWGKYQPVFESFLQSVRKA
jgi:hypothetical protein